MGEARAVGLGQRCRWSTRGGGAPRVRGALSTARRQRAGASRGADRIGLPIPPRPSEDREQLGEGRRCEVLRDAHGAAVEEHDLEGHRGSRDRRGCRDVDREEGARGLRPCGAACELGLPPPEALRVQSLGAGEGGERETARGELGQQLAGVLLGERAVGTSPDVPRRRA